MHCRNQFENPHFAICTISLSLAPLFFLGFCLFFQYFFLIFSKFVLESNRINFEILNEVINTMKKLICLLLALVMVMAMTACADENKKPYEEAVAAYNAGDYENAVQMLKALGDYEDAAQLLATIKTEKTGVTMNTTTTEGIDTSSVEYTFKDGNLIKETLTHADGTVTKNYYKYNDINLCTSETHNNVDGTKTIINNFYKDSIKLRSTRINPNKTKDTYEYTCDEQGKVLTHVLTLADGTVEEAVYNYDTVTGQLVSIMTANSSNTFAYNQFGDLSNETLTIDGVEVYKATYTYTYNYFVG